MIESKGIKKSQAGKRSRLLTAGISAFVFVASIWYIGGTYQWCEVGQVLKSVNLTCLVVGGGVTIMVFWMLRTLRWHILLLRTDTHVPMVDLYLCTAVSLSFAIFTPLQSGEMLKVELLKKYGMIQRSPGYGSFLVERALDLTVLLAIACISLLTILNILPNSGYLYGILASLALACMVGWILLAKVQFKGRLQQMLEHMRQCVGDASTLFVTSAITCLSWAAVAFSWQVFLYAGGIHLDFAQALAMMSIMALVCILSFIPGGLGISEAGIAQVLMHFGCAAALAQAGSLILRSS
jgi:uncharacterized membrane protein YbhN (UPF0104 family)